MTKIKMPANQQSEITGELTTKTGFKIDIKNLVKVKTFAKLYGNKTKGDAVSTQAIYAMLPRLRVVELDGIIFIDKSIIDD